LHLETSWLHASGDETEMLFVSKLSFSIILRPSFQEHIDKRDENCDHSRDSCCIYRTKRRVKRKLRFSLAQNIQSSSKSHPNPIHIQWLFPVERRWLTLKGKKIISCNRVPADVLEGHETSPVSSDVRAGLWPNYSKGTERTAEMTHRPFLSSELSPLQ
jgi:hypothetical protein